MNQDIRFEELKKLLIENALEYRTLKKYIKILEDTNSDNNILYDILVYSVLIMEREVENKETQ